MQMNNEPVAWMDYLEHSDVYDLNVSGRGIPLYTHPAKTLTDEEIEEVMMKSGYGEVYKFVNPFDFARAILKKAQEK
jgi:hypothetical protein